VDFLNGHKQFVRSGDSVSNTTIVGAGTPQCTVSGPNDFKLVINDLTFNTCYVKYVGDTTVLSISKTVNDNTLQAAADHLVHWTQNSGMMINTNKTKELIICFSKKVNVTNIPPFTGCAAAQHCYNGDVSFLWEKWKL